MHRTLLIDDPEAESYAGSIRDHFPNLDVIAGTTPDLSRKSLPACDAAITFGGNWDRAWVSHAPRLRWIQALSTGTDHFKAALVDRPDVILTSCRGIHGRSVSEHALMMMLALSRRLPSILEAQRNGQWVRQTGELLAGKTVGIAGMGVIGRALAQRCRACEMTSIGFGSVLRDEDAVDRFATYADLVHIAPRLDFLVVVMPLTAQTSGLIDSPIFEAMKPTGFLVNVGRGATVVEADLIDALRAGRIAGAALDAFTDEPLREESPFWTMPNVIVSPHVAGSHSGYFEDSMAILRGNIAAYLADRPAEMVNRVDFAKA